MEAKDCCEIVDRRRGDVGLTGGDVDVKLWYECWRLTPAEDDLEAAVATELTDPRRETRPELEAPLVVRVHVDSAAERKAEKAEEEGDEVNVGDEREIVGEVVKLGSGGDRCEAAAEDEDEDVTEAEIS